SLRHNFKGCCFAASQLNFSKSSTNPHADFMNVFFLVCGIWNCGAFNYRLGGHIILWSLGLAVEFPPGAGVLVPSATVVHSNIPVASNE
ncbi:hypothetical protein GYMLUDRAFT_160890, partial [Collybiopsis luxurians FD-317 M1]